MKAFFTLDSTRRHWLAGAAALSCAWAGLPVMAQTPEAPDVLIQRVAEDVFNTVKRDAAIQAGDTKKIAVLVDGKLMPHINFTRMTASSVGRFWRQATPDQKQKLQVEFKTLLVRTYSGALTQVKDQTLTLKPMRSRPEDTEVVVRSEIRGKGDPIQLDYRMEKTPDGWKVFDINVMGVWLIETYRGQFAQEINAKGIEGLIASLTERNRNNAKGS